MPPQASPALRALRRLAARDPESPLRLDGHGTLVWLRAVLAAAIRPIVRSMDELLGGSGTERSRTPMPAATEGAAEQAPTGSRPARISDVVGDSLVGLARRRRALGAAACLLVVFAAGVSTMPISAAGPTPSPEDIYVAETPAGQPLADASAGDETGVDDDASIYNVMQAVDAPVGATGFQIYVVRGGDTLARIGSKFGLNRLSVYWANASRLPDPSKLRVGQKLVIPPADGVTVTVKANDTLSGFASRYRVSTKAIETANKMAGTTLAVGQLVLIPVTPPPIPTPTPPKPVSGGGGSAWHGGKLRWPVPASRDITQYYSRNHPAIDIAAPTGTYVIAAVSGTVIWSGWKTSGGGYGGGIEIWVSSGGKLYTTYNHLSRTLVKAGQTVSAGQHIGNVGTTGNATGPHLHFEVWVCYPWSDGTTSCARNPLNYL